jgi:hypothetical protein
MFRVGSYAFEAEKGQSIHEFINELYTLFDISQLNITGIFNGIELNVNKDETPKSLYWQYMYKNEVRS